MRFAIDGARQIKAKKVRAIVDHAIRVLAEYDDAGFSVTLRQVFYKLVSDGVLINRPADYRNLGRYINTAKEAGEIDWGWVEDETRYVRSRRRYRTTTELLEESARDWHMDFWAGQPIRPELWIEKDALLSIIAPVCHEFDVPYYSLRGWSNPSDKMEAAQRFSRYAESGQQSVILHAGDHDPTGLSATENIKTEITRYMRHLAGEQFADVRRIALNRGQIEQLHLAPNKIGSEGPKDQESRWRGYVQDTGTTNTWELDALPPTVLQSIVRKSYRPCAWNWNEAPARQRINSRPAACAGNRATVRRRYRRVSATAEESGKSFEARGHTATPARKNSLGLERNSKRSMSFPNNITVVITTSPIKSHPSTSIIDKAHESVRSQLGGVAILLLVDGVRSEQEQLAAAYEEYLEKITWARKVRFRAFTHQAGMMRYALSNDLIATPLVLWQEHDWTLEGKIPWTRIESTILSGEISCIRFSHDEDLRYENRANQQAQYAAITGKEMQPFTSRCGVPLFPTVNWNSLPHVAHLDFYRHLCAIFNDAKIHLDCDQTHELVEKSWSQFPVAIYNPEGSIKRCSNLVGRQPNEPKYPMIF